MNGLIIDLFSGGQPPLHEVPCQKCERPFVRKRKWHRFCSDLCQQRARKVVGERSCKACRKPFMRVGRGDGNRWHCSVECARVTAKAARKAFEARRPEADRIYRERQRAKKRRDTTLERFWKKHPEMPRCCEACGETRVLDLAHRPEHRRNGAWKTMANCRPEMVWVLCPTDHALLDRLGYTPKQLGIEERECKVS